MTVLTPALSSEEREKHAPRLGELAPKERWYPIQVKQKCVPIWFTSVLSCPMTDQSGRRKAGIARFLRLLGFEAVYPETSLVYAEVSLVYSET